MKGLCSVQHVYSTEHRILGNTGRDTVIGGICVEGLGVHLCSDNSLVRQYRKEMVDKSGISGKSTISRVHLHLTHNSTMHGNQVI